MSITYQVLASGIVRAYRPGKLANLSSMDHRVTVMIDDDRVDNKYSARCGNHMVARRVNEHHAVQDVITRVVGNQFDLVSLRNA